MVVLRMRCPTVNKLSSITVASRRPAGPGPWSSLAIATVSLLFLRPAAARVEASLVSLASFYNPILSQLVSARKKHHPSPPAATCRVVQPSTLESPAELARGGAAPCPEPWVLVLCINAQQRALNQQRSMLRISLSFLSPEL